MPIVSSTHSVGHAQAGGRRYVTELHTDDVGAPDASGKVPSFTAQVNAQGAALINNLLALPEV